MKKYLLTLVLMPLMMWAETKGITWTYNNGEAQVGIGSYGNPAISTLTEGSITIPSSHDGCPVTSVGSFAFYGCSEITSVTIPSSVMRIGDSAFSFCIGLTSVEIPSSVTNIGKSAFYRCSGLASVTIPSSITSITDDMFNHCDGLISVTIPECVTSIGNGAFEDCSGLTSVTIPSSVTSIGYYAFSGCSGLTSVTIPEGVMSIGDFAFYGCSGLTSATIPSSVTSIGLVAFEGCDLLMTVYVDVGDTDRVKGLLAGSGFDVSEVKFVEKKPDGGPYKEVVDDIEWMFVVRDGEAQVGSGSYDAPAIPLSTVGAITIPSVLGGCPVTSIGDYAFYECNGISSITIPSSVTSIDGFCTLIHYSESGACFVIDIGNGAFGNCRGLLSFSVVEDNPVYTSINGLLCTKDGDVLIAGVNGEVTIPSSVTMIGMAAFFGCTDLTSVTIPSSVTNIEDYAFSYCSGLTSVTIPSSVTSIGDYAFNGCSGLTSVTIPSSVTSIGYYAFSGCSGLTSVTIPEGVMSIGNSAFLWCSGLTSATIPSSVTNIGYGVFGMCSNLINMAVAADNPNYKSVDSYLLSKDGSELIRGPSKEAVAIPHSVASIGDSAFAGCGGFTSVMIPSNVTSIGRGAFECCNGLTSVTIPSSVTNIGYRAFGGCSSLKTIYVDAGDAERIKGLLNDSTLLVVHNAIGIVTQVTILDEDKEFISALTIIERVHLTDILSGFTWDDTQYEDGKLSVDGNNLTSSGYSIRMFADDNSETWLETVVTGDVRVAFAWKVSCESPMLDDKDELCFFDRLEFRVDGEAIDAIAGEEAWSTRTFNVWGEGEHRLRWAYVKDASDSEGEDSGWVAEIQIDQYERVDFAVGDEVLGEVPAPLMGFVGDEVVIPESNLSWPKHTFVGWSDGVMVYNVGDTLAIPTGGAELTAVWEEKHLAVPEISAPDVIDQGEAIVTISAEEGTSIYYTLDENDPNESSTLYTGPFVVKATCTIKAIAIKEDYFDSAIVEKAITRLPYTFGEYLGMENQEFSTSGDAEWGRAQKDGRYVLQSGAIGDSKSSVLSTIFTGSGRLNFVYAVSSEAKKGIVADGLALYVDDFATKLMWDGGEVDWKEVNFDIVGEGDHTVRWVYAKNAQNSSGDDCAWLDEIRWTPDDAGTGEIVVNDPDGYIILPDGKDITEVEVKVISNGYDIFPYLKLPQAVNGVIDLSQAEVKVEIVEAVLDPEKGAKVELNAENPTLTTSATIPGLTYTLHEGATLESMQSGDSKVGDGTPWTPTISVKGGKSAFYSISVGK